MHIRTHHVSHAYPVKEVAGRDDGLLRAGSAEQEPADERRPQPTDARTGEQLEHADADL